MPAKILSQNQEKEISDCAEELTKISKTDKSFLAPELIANERGITYSAYDYNDDSLGLKNIWTGNLTSIFSFQKGINSNILL